MPKVLITKQTDAQPNDAYTKVKAMLSEDGDLHKLDPGYKCEFNDQYLTGQAKGKMFKADLTVQKSGSGSKIEITVDLPLALTLAKGMIQKTLEKKLTDTLA